MVRQNNTFLEWMYFIKSIHYCKAETEFLTNKKDEKINISSINKHKYSSTKGLLVRQE